MHGKVYCSESCINEYISSIKPEQKNNKDEEDIDKRIDEMINLEP